MPESRHGYLTTNEGIHVAYQWIFLNEADRLAKTDFVATDVGKLARQQDDNTLWLLDDLVPTWVAVTGVRQLSGLSDVDLDSIPLADGQILSYNATYDVWQPTEIADFVGSYALNDLDDVDVTPSDGQLLSYNALSGNWIATDYPHTHPWSDITSGIPETATRWPTWTEVTDKPTTFAPSTHAHDDLYYTEAESNALFAPLTHAHAWADITSGVPDFATRWPTWTEVTDKPTTFTPSSHTHDDLYYTETESNALFAPLTHAHAWADITSGAPDFATRWPTWTEVTDKPTTFAYTDVANVFSLIQTIQGVNAQIALKTETTAGVAQIQIWEDVGVSPVFKGAIQYAGTGFGDSRAGQLAVAGNSDVVLGAGFQVIDVPFVVKGTAGYHTLVGQGAADLGQLSIKTDSVSTRGIVVDTPASPTANLLELRNNGSPKVYIGADGSLTQDDLTVGTFHTIKAISTSTGVSYYTYSTLNHWPRIRFFKSNTASKDVGATTSSGNYLGGLQFGGVGTSLVQGYGSAYWVGTQDGAAGLNYVPVSMLFLATDGSAGPSEKARLRYNGHLLLNTTTDSAQLTVKTSATDVLGVVIDTPASPTANLLELRSNTTPLFWVEANGDVFSRHAYPYYIMDMASATDRATILFRELSGSYQPYNSVNAYGTTYGDAALNGKLEMKSSWGVVINTNGAPQFEIGLTGQIKVNQAVATSASTDQPSATAPYRLPIYNMAGTLLGYIPIYSTWS